MDDIDTFWMMAYLVALFKWGDPGRARTLANTAAEALEARRDDEETA
jgi:hypothetical protein